MSLPDVSDVHVNGPLTNISIAFGQDAKSFIADRVFPVIPVKKKSDLYFEYLREYWHADEMQPRAPSSESHGASYGIAQRSYQCQRWALHKDIDDEERANEDSPLDADQDATNFLTEKRLIRRERIFAANYMQTSVWTTDITGVSGSPSTGQVKQWNDAASTPIEDVRAAMTAQQLLTGRRPNTLALTQPVVDKLADHPDFVDRIKYGQTAGGAAIVNLSAMAALFDVQNVYVSSAVYNSAKEGLSASNAFIVGKAALLCYVPPAPSLRTPSAGYTFSWSDFDGSMGSGSRIRKLRMDLKTSDRIEIEAYFDMKKVAADMGTFFASIVA